MKGTSPAIIALRAFLVCLMFISIFFSAPVYAAAIEFAVNPNKSGGCSTADNCYTTIQAAIDEADRRLNLVGNTDSFTILVESGTYAGPITLKPNIPVRGRETARTILTGGGNGTVVIADSTVTGVTFKNFTITSAAIGIDVSGGSSLTITNNIFQVGTGSSVIAVRVQSTASGATSVTNNTFYQNGIALSTSQNIQINNNIFSNFSTAISTSGQEISLITYNVFTVDPLIPNLVFSGGIGGVQNRIVSDPKFVKPAQGDFHLQATSECIDRGTGTDIIDNTTADIGAYGGSNADSIPFRMAKPAITGTSATTIDLSWSPNDSYLTGGYNVYYRLSTSSTYSSVDALTSTTITLSGLSSTPSAPAAPTLNTVTYANEALIASWSTVPEATGYKVYYLDTVTSSESVIDAGNKYSQTISSLVNGRNYTISVTSYTQNIYNIAVTTYDNVSGATLTPGVQHESAYSEEESVTLGTPVESSSRSNTITAFPEAITPYPNLPNNGCFIATAAYGYYSAPEVMALRQFRDRYLVTNAPGRLFVQWYYRVSPGLAAFITEHPSLKPVARTALLPAVGIARFMTQTAPVMKLAVLLSLAAACVLATLSIRSVLVRTRLKRRPR